MARIERAFENLMLDVKRSVSTLRPASYDLLDTLIEKSKRCFAAQKSTHQLGMAYQTWLPLAGLAAPLASYGLTLLSSKDWINQLHENLNKDASTRFQISSKFSEVLKGRSDAESYDHQALQKQIDNMSAELASAIQAQTVFLQSLETAMQKHQQILESAKR